ncbi:MAG: membrane dipeptidase [Saprospiraceae bacterium]|nr:membrane dipeptidase [Saprospiraceae bacterium]
MEKNMLFIFDAHLDLSMNAIDWNRDIRLPIEALRLREEGKTDQPDRGRNTVTFGELRKGNIGLVVATQIARFVAPDNPLPGWQSPEQAWAQTQAQLAWYRVMEDRGFLRQITNKEQLDNHLQDWQADQANCPIGYILSLEGADSIIDLSYLERAYGYGLRALGPAHYGPGRYAFGTDSSGGLGQAGKDLLREMEILGIILDATHLCDVSFWEALDHFHGPVWASHNMCRSLVNHNRQFSDEQIKVLIERGTVIGAAFDAWMIVPDWQRGKSKPIDMACNLEKVVDHIDHICQIAGNAQHVMIGSDLDGGFGKEQCPYDIDTIADLQKLPEIFKNRGYKEEEIRGIMHGNALGFIRLNLK